MSSDSPYGPARPNLALGVAATLGAFALLAVGSAFVKAAAQSLPVSQIVFFQGLICLALSLPACLAGGLADLRTDRLGLHVVRSFAGILGFVCFFVSIRHIPLAEGILLNNCAPLYVPFIVWIWGRKRFRKVLWIPLITGFAGMALILNPSAVTWHWAVVPAVTSGIFFGTAIVAVRRLVQTDPPMRTLFYYFVITCAATLPVMLAQWKTPEPRVWLHLVGAGVTIWGFQYLFAFAYRFALPSRLAPFNYSIVVYGAILDWLIWGHVPTLAAASGALLIALGGVLTIRFESPAGKDEE